MDLVTPIVIGYKGMIFLDQSGEGIQVELGPTVERELDDTILRLKGRGLGLRKIAEVINRSHMYVKRRIAELKSSAEYDVAAKELSERLGNPGSVPYGVGKIGWTPRVERIRKTDGKGSGGQCPTCNGELGPIGDGSVFVCLACTRTCRDQAIENELRRERIMKEEAEQREAERRAAELEERRASRRDRKKANKASKSKRNN